MKFNLLKISVLVVIVLSLFGFANMRNGARVLDEVNIDFELPELQYLNEASVNKLLIQNYGDVKSGRKDTIDLNEIEQLLIANPMVLQADAYLFMDNRLDINVSLRRPIGRVMTASKHFYIDETGSKMAVVQTAIC